ncbi:hypothetical protein [Rubrobacter indicoceani]|uniref:hypothetical protein n=1 Tax=Rubrobacter indicoceani TaxID=2051957 RepID=UPI000E5A5C4C|nr:hypothetical protein [Rubrobacter indicoceani]
MERDSSSNAQNTASGSATEQTKQQTRQVAHQARRKADELTSQGSEQIKSQLAAQKHQVAQRMMPVQTALRETAQQLRKQDQRSVGQYADQAANQVERFSGYLRETDVDQMLEETRSLARRRPALFLGGATILGFLGARFLKSSSQSGSSAGNGSAATGGPTGSHRTREPALGVGEREPAAPAGGQPLSDRYEQMGRTEPPRSL